MSKRKIKHPLAEPVVMPKPPIIPLNPNLIPTLPTSQPSLRSKLHRSHNPKLIGFVVVATLVIITGAVIAWRLQARSANKSVATHVCTNSSNPSLKQAVATFLPGQQVQFQQMVQKIMKMNNYQQDPNCLYFVIVYNFSVDDTLAANTNLIQLQKVYDPKQGFDPMIGGVSITNLQSELAAIEKAATAQTRQ